MTLPAPLQPLAQYTRFIIYRLEPDTDKPGKMAKYPCDWRTGNIRNAHDPESWTTYENAAANSYRCDRGHGHGVGFATGPDCPIKFLDVDGAFVGGHPTPIALDLLSRMGGAAWEVSQSGTGLHAFCHGEIPPGIMVRNKTYGVELYGATKQFCALTGNMWDRAPAGSADARVDLTGIGHYFERAAAPDADAQWTDGPDEGYDPALMRDEVVLERMLKGTENDFLPAPAGAGPRTKLTLKELWDGVGLEGDEESELDQALACHLMWWLGRDCERTERFMRMSGRVREKWDTHRTYLRDFTIIKARRLCTGIARPLPPITYAPAEPTFTIAGPHTRPQIVHAIDMPRYFSGCVYVADRDAIFVPEGVFLKHSAFDGVYGGPQFVMDQIGDKKSKSAWEAFRLNESWLAPRSHSTCFRPELPSGAILAIEGLAYLNCYVPIDVDRVAGDATPFIGHVRRMLPNGRDADLLLHYMASVVQNPGAKFQWWPFVQGVKGNGKTMLLTCMVNAIGSRYCHLVNPTAMVKTGNQFNSWIENKLFLGFEEVYTNERREMSEALKATVTNRRLAMEGKGRDQTTVDNRANGLLLSNHRDAITIEDDERRFAVFFCAQQDEADLRRDGMDGRYFPALYDWLNNGGFAIVAHFLATMPLQAEMDPARDMHRAPHTSSTSAAIGASYGVWEQEVLEAIEEGRQGFCGGLVSSAAVSRLLQARRVNVGPRKIREIMKSIGYEWHPALKDGRVNNPLGSEGKPRLYAKRGSPVWALATCPEVAAAYTEAQSTTPPPVSNVVPFSR